MKTKDFEKLIIVLGKNYSTTLGAIRALGEQCYKIEVHFITSNNRDNAIVKRSSYIKKFFSYKRSEIDGLVRNLISLYAQRDEKTLLLPTDDLSASILDLHYNELSPYFLMPHAGSGQGEIVKLMDKAVQKTLAESFGLKTAQSWTVQIGNGAIKIPSEIRFPCFYKPTVSFEGGKRGMKKCSTRHALIQELEQLQQSGGHFSVIVQEYLNIEEEYSISGFCCGTYVYMPAILRKIQISQAHKGTTVLGIIERFDNESDVYQRLIRLLSSLELYSIVDVEVFQCGNQLYFNEINFRTSAVCYGIVAGGVNIPGLYVQSMYGNPPETISPDIKFSAKFLCEKAAWDDYNTGIISKSALKELYEDADIFIIRSEYDPGPEKAFLKMMVRIRCRHRIKRVLVRMKILR